MIEHTFPGAAALGDVALQAAAQTFLVARGHEHRQIQELADLGMMEREDSFHNKYGLRIDAARLAGAGVLIEEIDRLLDRLAAGERGQMRGEQRPVESVGMIVVERGALLKRQMGLRVIVGVERENFAMEMRRELARQRCFSGAGEARDTDYEGFQIRSIVG